MNEDLKRRILRAKELLTTSRHACMATVNEDGSPHNTPFRFLYDPKLEYVYWGSHLESIHSLNVERTGQVFVVLYDAMKRGGLYMQARNAHILSGEELNKALAIHNVARVKEEAEPLGIDYYTGNGPQRIWGAEITDLWVNDTKRGEDGLRIKDSRTEITASDLLD